MISGSFLTVDEAAQAMGCSAGRVRQLLRAGRLEGEKVSPRVWMVRKRSLQAYEREKSVFGRKRLGYRGD